MIAIHKKTLFTVYIIEDYKTTFFGKVIDPVNSSIWKPGERCTKFVKADFFVMIDWKVFSQLEHLACSILKCLPR